MSDSITKYKSLRPLYKSFTDKLVALLKEILDDNGIKYYSIERLIASGFPSRGVEICRGLNHLNHYAQGSESLYDQKLYTSI